MLSQQEFVEQCLIKYRWEQLPPGQQWHDAHYPVPECLGGTETVKLWESDHAIQAILQSEEYRHKCFYGWEKRYLPEDLLPLYYKWHKKTSQKWWASLTEKQLEQISSERSKRIKAYWDSLTPAERSARNKRKWKAKTKNERSAVASKSANTRRTVWTEEQWRELKRKQSVKKNPRPVIVTTPDGQDFYFDCIFDACERFDLSSCRVGDMCAGRRKRHKGYTARYQQ